MKLKFHFLKQPLILLVIFVVNNECYPQFALQKYVFGSGGGDMASAQHKVSGTLGQTFTGRTTSLSNVAHIGFWYAGETMIDVKEPATSFNSYIQIYPNPTGNTATVFFKTEQIVHVKIKLVSITGHVDLTIADEKFGPGEYRLLFSAKELAEGIYICYLKADDFIQSRLISIIRQ